MSDELPLSEELIDELELDDPLTEDVLLLLSEKLLKTGNKSW